MSKQIVAYGTLRVGEYNYERFSAGITKIVETDKTIKGFIMYDFGSYPVVRRSFSTGNPGFITVDILEVTDETFEDINAMETGAGYVLDVYKGCYIWIYPSSVTGLPFIPSGDWKAYNNQVVDDTKRKIFIVGQSGREYINWMEGVQVKKIEDADLVVFTGGEDVSPSLYGENEGYRTYSNLTRDTLEVDFYNKALSLGLPMVGICRGSQLLCVLNKGRLIQHMEHPGNHNIKTSNGLTLLATSTHHQMQYPYDLPQENYKVLGWAEELSQCHLDGDNQNIEFPKFAYDNNRMMEPEIVLYPKTKCLGIQMHPEYWDPNSPNETHNYLRGLLNNLVSEKKVKRVKQETEELPF